MTPADEVSCQQNIGSLSLRVSCKETESCLIDSFHVSPSETLVSVGVLVSTCMMQKCCLIRNRF